MLATVSTSWPAALLDSIGRRDAGGGTGCAEG